MLRNKEAAIESPSEKEKIHINEEEQSIDTPVVDNKKIKKCCKEANTMYDDMVKEAYEEICGGIEKEAECNALAVVPKRELMAKASKKGHLKRIGAVGAGALGVAGAAYGGKKLYDKHQAKKSREEEVAEKAAAYYDEAQYAKEAAEADYAEACAYEDAALQILDELGYLD